MMRSADKPFIVVREEALCRCARGEGDSGSECARW